MFQSAGRTLGLLAALRPGGLRGGSIRFTRSMFQSAGRTLGLLAAIRPGGLRGGSVLFTCSIIS
jgi:hypothetical protein